MSWRQLAIDLGSFSFTDDDGQGQSRRSKRNESLFVRAGDGLLVTPIRMSFGTLKGYLCPVHSPLHSCFALLTALVLALPLPARGAHSSVQVGSKAEPAHRSSLLASTAKDCRAEIRAPAWCASELEAQLVKIRKHPRDLVRLRSLRGIVRLAKIELLRAHHRLGAKKQSQELVRELISTQALTSEELLHLGPELTRDVEQEQLALDRRPLGLIRVECDDACAVLINEVLMNRSSRLPYGNYRLVTCAANPDVEPLEQQISLSAQASSANLTLRVPLPKKQDAETKPEPKAQELPAQRKTIVEDKQGSDAMGIQPQSPSTALPQDPTSDTMILTQPLVRPVLPRPVLRAGIGIGLLATMTGSAFIAIDEFCFKKEDTECKGKNRLQTKELGLGVMVAGGVFLVTTAVALIAERVRGRRARETWIRQRGLSTRLQARF